MRGLGDAIRHIASRSWNRLLHHEQLVYEWPIEIALGYRTARPDSAEVAVYESVSEVPTGVIRSFVQQEGEWFLHQMTAEFEGGATLVVIEYCGRPASILWAKQASRVPRWYVPLRDSDVVLFGWHTTFSHRGRGLIGIALQAAVRRFSSETIRFLADVRVWNRPSIRAMEKAGFRFVGRAKPLR